MLKQVHCYVVGSVVGVGYRMWTLVQANALGVTGWVRNTHDHPDIHGSNGGVEVLIQGEDVHVDEMVCKLEEGPSMAHVDEVISNPQHISREFDSFTIVK